MSVVRVVVLHTVPSRENAHGFAHGVPHNEKTPFAVVLWDSGTKTVKKIVKRYVSLKGAWEAAQRAST